MSLQFRHFDNDISDQFFEKGRVWFYTTAHTAFETVHELTPLAISTRGVVVAQTKTRSGPRKSLDFAPAWNEGDTVTMQIDIDDIPLSDTRISGRIAKINNAPDRIEIGILFEDFG